MQWRVTAFNLTFACFTLAWGALADAIGRKRSFGIGAAIYVAASAVSALSQDVYVLDIARATAGIGAAAIFSAGSALLATEFDGAARMRAFALAGATIGIGVGIGPSLSGLLVGSAGWRAIFVIHAVLMTLVLAALTFIRETAPRRADVKIDVAGTALFILCALALITGIVQGTAWGWTSARILGLFAASGVLLALFIVVERSQAQPMFDLSILSNRGFLGWCLATMAPSFGFFTLLTYLPTYLNAVAGLSPVITGASMLLMAGPLLVCPIVAAKLVGAGTAAKTVLFTSLLFLIGGDLAMRLVHPTASLMTFAIPMLLVGVGTGLSAGLADGQALSKVSPEKSGFAAGFSNTLRLAARPSRSHCTAPCWPLKCIARWTAILRGSAP